MRSQVDPYEMVDNLGAYLGAFLRRLFTYSSPQPVSVSYHGGGSRGRQVAAPAVLVGDERVAETSKVGELIRTFELFGFARYIPEDRIKHPGAYFGKRSGRKVLYGGRVTAHSQSGRLNTFNPFTGERISITPDNRIVSRRNGIDYYGGAVSQADILSLLAERKEQRQGIIDAGGAYYFGLGGPAGRLGHKP